MTRVRNGSRLLALLAAGALAAAPAGALWPSAGGGVDADGVTATAVDANGNVYALGTFSGTAYFGEEVLYARGLSDVFVVKHEPGGKVLWAASAGGLLVDAGYDLVVDAAQNVYVVGSFMKEMKFENDDDVFSGGGALLELGRSGSIGRDWFVAKLDSQGGWLWAGRSATTRAASRSATRWRSLRRSTIRSTRWRRRDRRRLCSLRRARQGGRHRPQHAVRQQADQSLPARQRRRLDLDPDGRHGGHERVDLRADE